MSYDAFVPLAERTLYQICTEAAQAFDERMLCYVEHYKGRLNIGGISVIVGVGSPHRDEGFKACRYIIEELKVRAPLWKQEHYVDGDDEWMSGASLNRDMPTEIMKHD